ncbi:hypothetical protein DMN91_006073 [Ooceraea biroi]|uniref:Uncharacterized protein n=1 Tax=Ooceraea biroi TaxID=2015173 RepID=A0A3L8DMQ6_OOCBI|nr:hypothetical protein DMN91_006073 [Ooceraea biroi]
MRVSRVHTHKPTYTHIVRSFHLRVKAPFWPNGTVRDTERRDSFTRGVIASPKGAVIDIGGTEDERVEEKKKQKREREEQRCADWTTDKWIVNENLFIMKVETRAAHESAR